MSQNQRLKEVRIALNMNQQEFADACGVRQDDISRMEKKMKISIKVIRFLYQRDVNILWLLDGDGEMFMPSGKRRYIENDQMPPVTAEEEQKIVTPAEKKLNYMITNKEISPMQLLEKFIRALDAEMKTTKKEVSELKKELNEVKRKLQK